MTYDGENRPLSVLWNGVLTEYVYAATGTRLKMIGDVGTASEAETLYLGPLEVRDFGTTGAVTVATPHPDVRLVEGVVSHLHHDQLGSAQDDHRQRRGQSAAGAIRAAFRSPLRAGFV